MTEVGAGSEAGQPKVLVLHALRWLSVLRVAFELSQAGFRVEAACPGGYPTKTMPFVKATYRYNSLAPISVLRNTILEARPMLLVPCDDYVTRQLHDLYHSTPLNEPDAAWLRDLIVRSLGAPEHFSLLYSRHGIGSLARELDIPAPASAAVDDSTLMVQLDSLGLPVVLKSDGSWAGSGVVIAHSREEAVRAFYKLSAFFGGLRALKRLVFNRDPTLVIPCLRRWRPGISIQRFVAGRPATAAVACWHGKVLASVQVEVHASKGATGPATVVRVISHPGMVHTVERMVEQLRLSGLCGFDFVLGEGDGIAQLVEINPRATQTCYLVAADGKDLLAELRGALQGLPAAPRGVPCCEPLALFPWEAGQHRDKHLAEPPMRDIPWNSPELIKLGQSPGAR